MTGLFPDLYYVQVEREEVLEALRSWKASAEMAPEAEKRPGR